jgi:hypothetical protein
MPVFFSAGYVEHGLYIYLRSTGWDRLQKMVYFLIHRFCTVLFGASGGAPVPDVLTGFYAT